MFGNNLISTIAQKLGFQTTPAPTPAPAPAPTPVNPKNEMVPRAVSMLERMQSKAPTPTPPANSLISTIVNKMGLANAPLPTPLKSLPEPTADQINAAQTSERQTLQGVPRGFYRFGASTASALASAIGNPAPASVAPPTGVFGRTFLGTEPIDTYQTEYAKEKTASEAAGVPSYVVKPLAILSIAGESAGDLLGMLPEGEAGKALLGKQTDEIVSSLTKETDAAKASQTLKAANISPDIADKYAPQFAATTTPAETKSVLKSVASDQIQKTTDDATERLGQLNEKSKTAVLTPDELAEQTFLKKNISKPAELFNGYRTQQSMAEIKTENGVLPDSMKPESPEVQALADHTINRAPTENMADYIVGKKEDIDKLTSRSAELDARIQKARERQPFISSAEKDDFPTGVENMMNRLRADTGFGISAERQLARGTFDGAAQEGQLLDKSGMAIPREQVDNISRFVDDIGNHMFDDVGLSIFKKGGKQGMYEFGKSLVSIYKDNILRSGGQFDRTVLHELWHSLSRFLPEEEIGAISKQFGREADSYIKKNPWFGEVFNKQTQETVDELSKAKYDTLIEKYPEAAKNFTKVGGPGTPLTESYHLNFNDANYRFKHVDEFFAESLTDKTTARFANMDKESKGIIGFGKKIVRSMVEGVQRLFGRDVAGRISDNFFNGKYGDLERDGNLRGSGMVGLKEDPIKMNDGEIDQIRDSEGKVIYDTSVKETEPKMDGGATPATPAKIKNYNSLRQNLSDRWTKVVENFQNNKNRIEALVKNPASKVTTETDPALAHVLYSGRLDTRMRAVQDELAGVVDKTLTNAKSTGVGYQSFKDDVNDYLHSLHAPERNAALGENAAGITDEEAAKMQADLKAQPHFPQIKEVADKLLEMNRKTLDTLYQGGAKYGVIDKDTYDMIREKYKNHVPLNRVFSDSDNISDALTGRGFDVRGSGLKTAKGSAREVADIYTNITSNLAMAVQRVEKNIVDNATYDFVKENGEDMGFGHVLKSAPPSASDPRVLTLRVNGKDAWVKFDDVAVADQFKSVGNEHLPTMLRFIDTFTRFYSGLQTRFNLEFFASNKFRDLQEAMVYAASEGKLNAGSSVKILKREAQFQNEKAILDHMRSVDSPGARAYQSMLDNGGATGGMALSTRGQVETNLADIEKLAQSKPRQALQGVVHKIDQANEIFENSTRLSVYREGLAQGLSEKEAAAMAKESTVNFNRKGKFGSVINSLYMFSNASLQGSVKMFRAMRNPKVLAATALTVGSAVFLTNKHNDSVDPNWRDKVSTFDRESNMVVVVQGGDQDFKYITIPVSYALKPFKVAFDGAYDLASGNKGTQAKNVLESTVAAVVNGYNPVGGTDLGSALTPTIADVPREIGVNKSWTGSKIRPDDNADLPASRQYFDSLKDTPTGRAMIGLTKTLSDHHIAEISPANMAYAVSQYSGGAGQFVSKVFNTVENSIQGQSTKPADIPFVSRFYKDVSGDELDARQQQNGNDGAMIKDLKEQGAAATFDKNEYVKDQIASIKAMKTPEEKSAAVDKILTDHPEMVQTILDQVKTNAKSYSTKEIEGLQVANGERAKFIVQKMATLTTSQEKAAFIDQLASDNLLTPQVVQQISALKGQESQ